MLKIGITGGIGSGKSMVSRIFSMLSVPVYSADERARYLMENNDIIKNALISKFGIEIYDSGKLNRIKLAEIIFNNKEAIDFVNKTVHPVVGSDFIYWSSLQQLFPYCLKEAALLFESGLYHELDFIITVVCPEDIRIRRVMNRDLVSYEKVKERINNQWNDEKKIKLSDFIIYNDDKNSIIEQVFEIHSQLLKHI